MKIIILFCFIFVNSILAKDLTVWIMPNGANPKGTLEKILIPFEKENHVKVNVEVLDWGVAWSRISKALENGEGPNVLQLGTTWLGHFIKDEKISDLTKYSDKINISRFYNVSLNTCKLYNSKHFYAFPWFIDVRVLLANKKLLDSSSINVKSNYSNIEFLNDLEKIKKSNYVLKDGTKISPYSFPGKQDWNIPHNFAPWIWGEGGDFIKFYNNKWHSSLLEKETVVGIYTYLNFVFDSLINTETLKENTSNVTQRFIRGEIGYIVSTTDVIRQLNYLDVNGGLKNSQVGQDSIYVLPMPRGRLGSYSFVGGSNLVIPKKYEKDNLSYKLLNYLLDKQSLLKYCNQIGFIPSDTSLWKEMENNRLYKNVFIALKSGKAYPQIQEWSDIEATLVSCFGDVWGLLDNYYSDSLLYNTLSKYDKILNKKLNSDSKHISYEELKEIANVFRNKGLNKKLSKDKSIDGQKTQTKTNVIIGIIILLMGLGLVIFSIQKMKNRK